MGVRERASNGNLFSSRRRCEAEPSMENIVSLIMSQVFGQLSRPADPEEQRKAEERINSKIHEQFEKATARQRELVYG